MSIISTTTKGKAGFKAAKGLAKRPRLLAGGAQAALPVGKLGLRASKPVLKRQARRRIDQLDKTAHTLGEMLAVQGPRAAYELGLAEPPKPKRTAPRVAAGVIIGASAVYFLEPEHGREHREKVAQIVG
jgi:hypothetical protein